MKKTFQINIAGFGFVIDEDAYVLLNEYLATIDRAFSGNPERGELVSDIEGRIAELLLGSTCNGSSIVTLHEVEDVIKRIGSAEEIIGESETSVSPDGSESIEVETASTENATPPPYSSPGIKKRLFRNPRNAMIGGVCSGIAIYFGIDPTWVRIAAILLTFASFSVCAVAYLILWLVLPAANTPYEQMEMTGEEPTIHNIGKTVTDTFQRFSESMRDNRNYTPSPSSEPRSGFATVAVIIGLVFAIPLFACLLLGILGCMFTLIMFATNTFTDNFWEYFQGEGDIVVSALACGFFGCLFLAVPLGLLIRNGMWKNSAPLSAAWRWIVSIVCVLSFAGCAVSAGYLFRAKVHLEMERRERIKRLDGERFSHRSEEARPKIEATPMPLVCDSVKTPSNEPAISGDTTLRGVRR